MFKPIAKDIKDQIISRIKENGEAVSKLSSEYSVSSKTIYYHNNQRIHTKLKTAPVKFRLDREYLFKELGT